jgi:hypothetical protein
LKEKIRTELREKKKIFDSLFWSFSGVFIISASICGRQENELQKSKP